MKVTVIQDTRIWGEKWSCMNNRGGLYNCISIVDE
jgi:hypothetical protein